MSVLFAARQSGRCPFFSPVFTRFIPGAAQARAVPRTLGARMSQARPQRPGGFLTVLKAFLLFDTRASGADAGSDAGMDEVGSDEEDQLATLEVRAFPLDRSGPRGPLRRRPAAGPAQRGRISASMHRDRPLGPTPHRSRAPPSAAARRWPLPCTSAFDVVRWCVLVGRWRAPPTRGLYHP